MTAYVAGFLFDPTGSNVALVRKNRPAWQAGHLNGIGGHVEPGEHPSAAMRREFLEEAGVDVTDWWPFAVISGLWGRVTFYRAFSELIADVRTVEDEAVEVYTVRELGSVPNLLPNLSWLVPLASYRHDLYLPVHAREIAPTST